MANELQLNYPEIISKIEGHYRDTIALIADVGNKIDKKLHFEPENKKLIIGRDTLKRTLANYRLKGIFGYYSLEGKILYADTEIEDYLKENYHPPYR